MIERMYDTPWTDAGYSAEVSDSSAMAPFRKNRKRRRKRKRRNTRRENRIAEAWVVLVVVFFGAAMYIGSIPLRERDRRYQEKEALLEQQYNKELERTKELEQQEAYTHTTRYIEEQARQKLRLVKPNEILLVPEPEE